MPVEITLDPTDHDDDALLSQISNWLHHGTRNAWTVEETDIEIEMDSDDSDDLGVTVRTLVTYRFHDSMDENDLLHRLHPRASAR